MNLPGFIGPAYTLGSVAYDCQSCVNMYLEQNELGTGKSGEARYLIGRPGLRKVLDTTFGRPWTGLYMASNGQLYGVAGLYIYKIDDDFTMTRLKNATGGIYACEKHQDGVCQFADNGVDMIIVWPGVNDGLLGPRGDYPLVGDQVPRAVVNLSTNIAGDLPDAVVKSPVSVAWKSGRFVLISADSANGRFWYSNIDSTTIGGTSFETAEGSPDPLNQVVSSNDYLWFAGDKTIEVWQTTAEPTAPFQRVSGAIIEYGCISGTMARVNNTVAWLGSQEGSPHIYAANGLQAQRISNHGVEQAIATYDTRDAYAWSYSDRGHNFYVISFPFEEKTWMYDFQSGGWCELTSFTARPEDGGHQARYLGMSHAYAYGYHVVGDRQTGKLYVMDLNYYQDDDFPIYRERTSPHLTGGFKRVFYRKFQVDCEMGNTTTTEPTVTYTWSDDGGRSFFGNRQHGLGQPGEYRTRAIWRRLGWSRDRVHRIRFTDPEKFILLAADIEVEAGFN